MARRTVPLALLALLFSARTATAATPFADYLTVEGPVADGFDLPQTTREGLVKAIAHGRVVARRYRPDGSCSLTVRHTFYENHHKKVVQARHDALSECSRTVGDDVLRGEVLGNAARAGGFGVQMTEMPGQKPVVVDTFVQNRKSLWIPQKEPVLVLVDHDTFRFALVHEGKIKRQIDIAFGQAAGRKEVRGDLKTPKGMYFVVHKYSGPFGGKYGAYYGGHWVKINYPNRFDAERGLQKGQISATTAQAITEAWQGRKLTAQNTVLGGGIGFHGWAYEWEPQSDGRYLSWGCMVLHLRDIASIYKSLPLGTMVVIF